MKHIVLGEGQTYCPWGEDEMFWVLEVDLWEGPQLDSISF